MRHIVKQSEPSLFTKWKACNPTATYKKDLKGIVKHKLKESLIEEQHYLCCYCECRITLETSHIEHLGQKVLQNIAHYN